ncbi:MAG: exodeoxyribonuclease I [Candidatus Microsaccharimonas sossegonensis]|uniref:Exodeoxyribonuclease I n=1 Tax=Candidatus Microsaccharimonas sossegonensis TaxID=2506948 RepID=A0A4Q0AGQ4_9BACT|nr:MAG: exodeoxyribonuclease I [Candidatus Microsaccharimonas sossegonensis]
MSHTFFFYDLETSGLSPQDDRIMQFAGIRTTLELEPIGEPYNILVKLNDDILPSPDALMVTGITPQQTQADGYTEAEFCRFLMEDVFTPDTITVGFNNIRFDDEFIRHLFWRNFYDPYEWTWKDGRSRWDMLDVTRMTRALRPEGIEWPFIDGKAVNKLELLTKLNGIDHQHAHDALSDVHALISVTRLIKEKQPQLYRYLFTVRDKKEVKKLVNLDDKRPFVYVSGRYDAEFHKATVAFPLTSGRHSNVIVYDLRHDPTPFLNLSLSDLEKRMYASWEERQADGFMFIPVKELQYNRAPAVAPLGVLEQSDGWKRVGLDEERVIKHRNMLLSVPSFAENIRTIFEKRPEFTKSYDAEAQLYDGFVESVDTLRIEKVRKADAEQLADLHPDFNDERLSPLLLHYKARNYPQSLTEDEVLLWEKWRTERITKQLPGFIKRLQALSTTIGHEEEVTNKRFVLEELQLWAESIVPAENY